MRVTQDVEQEVPSVREEDGQDDGLVSAPTKGKRSGDGDVMEETVTLAKGAGARRNGERTRRAETV